MPRGQRPKPISQQISEGDPRRIGKNKLQEKLACEPKAAEGLPPCPKHLRGHARAAWNFWRKDLMKMDLDKHPDAHMLEGACVAYELAVASYNTIQKQGRFIPKRARDAAGNWVIVDVKPHPAVKQCAAAYAQMRLFCGEFGLSPISRTRLAIEQPGDQEDDLWALLSKPREHRRSFPEAS